MSLVVIQSSGILYSAGLTPQTLNLRHVSQSSIVNRRTSIARATSKVHNKRMLTTSLCNARFLYAYFRTIVPTRTTEIPTRSEITRIISTACDRNQIEHCLYSKGHTFAQESPIAKVKVLIGNKFALWWCINLSFVTLRRKPDLC